MARFTLVQFCALEQLCSTTPPAHLTLLVFTLPLQKQLSWLPCGVRQGWLIEGPQMQVTLQHHVFGNHTLPYNTDKAVDIAVCNQI